MTKQSDLYDPKAATKTQTVNIDGTPVAETSVDTTDLPDGTTFDFTKPVDTTTSGEKTANITVTYPDGTTDTIKNVTIKVNTRAEQHDPQGKDQNVDHGETPEPEKSIVDFDKLPKNTKAAFDTEIDTTKPGPKTVNITVTYPDGTTDTIENVTITVGKQSDLYDPKAATKTQTVNIDGTPVAETSVDTTDLPDGTTFDFTKPVDTTTSGEKTANITVTYPDGTTDTIKNVTIKVNTRAEQHDPQGKDQNVDHGETPEPEKSIVDFDKLPKNTKAAFDTEIDTTKPGPNTVNITVTYPDGTTDTIENVTITVGEEAALYTPEAQSLTVKTGETPDSDHAIKNLSTLPKGTTTKFKGAVDTSSVGTNKVTIVVAYPDGTADEVTTDLTIKRRTDAEVNDPIVGDGIATKVGTTVTNDAAKKAITNLDKLPVKDVTFKNPVDTSKPGDTTATIVVSYTDGSTDEVKVDVHVNDLTDAEKYKPASTGITIKEGEPADPLAAISNKDELPKGITANFKGKVDTGSVGTNEVTIVVKYPDGTSEEIQTDLTVERRTDAEKNEPTVDENFEIIAGSKLRQEHAEKIIENIGSLPSGTSADFKDKGEGSLSTENPTPNDIDKDVTIVVTYPDGSTEEIDTKITIKPRPDNWDFQPQVREKVITAGDKLEAHDVIENLHELPQDIEVELDGDVDTSTPGAYNPQVVVTYPDGSQDRVGSTVIVNPKPLTNKQFDPNYGDTVKLTAGESKSAENPFGDETAPEGTKYEAKFRSDATDWTFDEDKANETGVVTAQAPSARDLAQEFARVTKYTHLDWDTLAAVLKPMVTTSVEVDIDYADGSFDAATATFELVDADGHSLLDPEADADGDGHTNRDEVEKRSNPFDEESVPVPPADWNTSNANTVYPGEDVTVPNNGGRVQVGTTVKVDGPGTAEINKDGDLVITANEDAKPGDKIVATMTDADGNQIDIVQVSVKEDERLQGDKTNASFGSDPYVLIPGETKDTNRPFGPFGIPDDTEITVQVPADATGWKFEGNEDGTVTAQAPSAAQLAAQFSALDKATQKDWDKLAEALAPVVAPTVGVNFTFTDGSNDFANARFELTDANDKSILDPDADFDDDGRTNKQEVDTGTNPFERNYFEPHWDATEGEGSAEPGGKLTIPNKGGKIPKGAIVDVAGPGSAVIDDRGNLVVAVEEQAIPGDEITATVKDEQGAEIQRIVIIVNAKVNSNTHTAVGKPGKDTSLSSNIDQGKCSAAAIGFGLPLLAIVPLAIATQAAIPGLAGFREQVAVQIEQVNSQIQNGLGIMNPQIAKQVSDINGQLRQYGTNVATIGGGLLLFAAGIGVTALIVDSCKPGGPTSSN
ncbi:Rib/alpha-like domain-containing protein [Corynebacterium hadale]|uniref:Rib/alpha-like domain-containing protein n=1 Tax=Corynebacterium hadale TaxID=2026255 RepID=UPI0013FD5F89|nr:Rib/alpha-like domain-containing protein [Corynebacterium hadale]